MDLGAPELLIILIIAGLLFGANKLPGLARGMGSAVSEFKKGQAEGAAPTKPDAGTEPKAVEANTEPKAVEPSTEPKAAQASTEPKAAQASTEPKAVEPSTETLPATDAPTDS